MQIRTVRTVVVGFSALGFGLFTAPVLENLFLEDRFNLDALDRGITGTASGVFAVFALFYIGPRFDKLWRRDPTATLRLIGACIGLSAVLKPIQYFMPTVDR